MSAPAATLDRRHSIDAAAVGFMLLLTFSWGLNGVAAKLANQGFNPVFLMLARSALAAVLVFAVVLAPRHPACRARRLVVARHRSLACSSGSSSR